MNNYMIIKQIGVELYDVMCDGDLIGQFENYDDAFAFVQLLKKNYVYRKVGE